MEYHGEVVNVESVDAFDLGNFDKVKIDRKNETVILLGKFNKALVHGCTVKFVLEDF